MIAGPGSGPRFRGPGQSWSAEMTSPPARVEMNCQRPGFAAPGFSAPSVLGTPGMIGVKPTGSVSVVDTTTCQLLIVSLMNLTEPSAMPTLTPPGWYDEVPLSAREPPPG